MHVEPAPAPSNINWANLDASKKELFLRRIISWLITLALWAITIAFITWIKNRQAILAQSVKPDKDCTGLSGTTKAEAEADNALGDQATGLLECYCRADSSRQLNENICVNWAFNLYLQKALPFVIVFAIIVTNQIMLYVFKSLASFEKHFYASTELQSRTIKIFIAQFLNTAVILLVVNTRFSQLPIVEFLNGVYNDFIPEWYFNVGTTLLITMFINMFSLPIINFIFLALKKCIQCCDRRCKSDRSITKKKEQSKYEALYTGPEFLIEIRYAQILNLLFVCLLYGSGLPFLYIITFVNLLIIYWLDKCYLLRICKLPKNYDEKLEEGIRNFLWIFLLVHITFAIWVYGNPTIFDTNLGLDSKFEALDKVAETNVPYVLYTWWTRAIRYQNLALGALFLILLVLMIVKGCFDSTLKQIYYICCKGQKQIDQMSKYKFQASYYDLVKVHDLEEDIKLLTKQLAHCDNEDLKAKLESRLRKFQELLSKKHNLVDEVDISSNKHFAGLFSYNIAHNPYYKPYFKVEGLKSLNTMSKA